MGYRILIVPSFKRDAKRLKKRYKSFEADLESLIRSLEQDPMQGVDLGSGVHKIRMAIASKGRGKRGGARVITYVDVLLELQSGIVALLAVYDKADQATISDNAIQA